MAKPLRPFVRGGGYYPSKKWIPLVRNGGYTTQNGGETEPVWATVSGAIASFTTPFAYPLKKLVAQINPVQDLHGYDAPWPAGGGVNKFDVSEIELNKNYNGSNNTGRCTLYKEYPAGTYIFNVPSYGVFNQIAIGAVSTKYDRDSGTARTITAYNEKQYSFTIDSTYKYFYFFAIKSDGTAVTLADVTALKPQLETGTTAHDWTPYSNLCPISGWTGLEGQRTGKNLFDKTEFTKSGWIVYAENPLRKMPIGTAVAFSINKIDSEAHGFSITVNSSVGSTAVATFAGYTFGNTVLTATVNITQTIIDCPYLQLNGNWNGLTADMVDNAHFQIEISASPTAYEPYTGEAISVSFGQTVYGGTDEVISGNLTATKGIVLAKDLSWSKNSGQPNPNGTTFQASVDAVPFIGWGATASRTAISNALVAASASGSFASENNNTFWWNAGRTGYRAVWGKSGGGSTLQEFLDFLTTNNVVFVCDLYEPIEYTHQGQSVDTLVGQNNVWVDTGDVEVTYRIG